MIFSFQISTERSVPKNARSILFSGRGEGEPTGRLLAAGGLKGRLPTQKILRAIASYPTLAKRVYRWPRHSGEDARRRSPRWLPTGVFLPCALFEFRTQTGPSSIGHKAVFFSNFYSITKNTFQLRSSSRHALKLQLLLLQQYNKRHTNTKLTNQARSVSTSF